MQISNASSAFSAYSMRTTANAQTVTDNMSTPGKTEKSGFEENGVFDVNALLHSSAVSDVVGFDDAGKLEWKGTDGQPLTSQQSLAWSAYLASQSGPSNLDVKLTNQDKAYIHKVTGLNAVNLGNSVSIVDDDGNTVSPEDACAALDMALHISGDRNDGILTGEITKDYATDLFRIMKDEKVSYSPQMLANSDDWFSTLMDMVSPSDDDKKESSASSKAYASRVEASDSNDLRINNATPAIVATSA